MILPERQALLLVGDARAGNEGAYFMPNNNQPNQERDPRQAQPGQDGFDQKRRPEQDIERPDRDQDKRKTDQERPQ